MTSQTVWIVYNVDMTEMEVLSEPPEWDLDESKELCRVANINGGDSQVWPNSVSEVAHRAASSVTHISLQIPIFATCAHCERQVRADTFIADWRHVTEPSSPVD